MCAQCTQGMPTVQALGRLPWLALFFLRARRLRPVLPMVSSSTRVPGAGQPWARPLSQVGRRIHQSATDGGPRAWMAGMGKGASATLKFTVSDGDTAVAVGSGDLAVLATPRFAGVVRGGHLRGHRAVALGWSDKRRNQGVARAPRRKPGRRARLGHRDSGVRRWAARALRGCGGSCGRREGHRPRRGDPGGRR